MESAEPIAGFYAPVHRALTEPILLGGAPRSLAIVNGTLAGAIGLGLRLWIAGLVIWAIGHALSVWAARRDFVISFWCANNVLEHPCAFLERIFAPHHIANFILHFLRLL